MVALVVVELAIVVEPKAEASRAWMCAEDTPVYTRRAIEMMWMTRQNPRGVKTKTACGT